VLCDRDRCGADTRHAAANVSSLRSHWDDERCLHGRWLRHAAV